MSTPEINRIRDRLRLLDQARAAEAVRRPALVAPFWRGMADLPWRAALGAGVLGLLILLAAGVFTARPPARAVTVEDAAVRTALSQLRPDARDFAFAEITNGASR